MQTLQALQIRLLLLGFHPRRLMLLQFGLSLLLYFFSSTQRALTWREMLQCSLGDLEWGAHAKDATDINFGLWKDNWLLS